MGVVEVGSSFSDAGLNLIVKEMMGLKSTSASEGNKLNKCSIRGGLTLMGHWLACGVPSENGAVD